MLFSILIFSVVLTPQTFGYGGGKEPDPRVCGDRLCSDIQDSNDEDMGKQQYSFAGDIFTSGIYICESLLSPLYLDYSFDLQPLKSSGKMGGYTYGAMSDICLYREKQFLVISFFSDFYNEGKMSIKIPREDLNPLTPSCEDDVFQIQKHGKFTSYEETKTADFREITFPIMANEFEITIFAENPENAKLCNEKIIEDEITKKETKFLAPKKQTNSGILPSEVKCKMGLELIFKLTDNSPACIKSKTAIKIIQRGWGTLGDMEIEISTDKLVYGISEPVVISLTNVGSATALFGASVGYSIKNSEGISIDGSGSAYEHNVSFLPNDQKYFYWNQGTSQTLNPKQIEPGIYVVKTSFRDLTGAMHTSEQAFEISISDKYYEFKDTLDPLVVNEFEKSDFVFVGKLISKINSTVPEFFTLNFETTENLKNIFNDEKTIDVHEGAREYCILQEGNNYLVFITKQKLQYTCTYTINSLDDIDDVRELSFYLYQK